MLHLAWPNPCPATPQKPAELSLPRHPRSSEPKAYAGLTHKPQCVACEQAPPAPPVPAPAAPPPRITSTCGRKRQVDTGHHFCPNPDCTYRGWVGWGNLRAHGHPNGGPWRQLLCVVCRRYFLETLGTLFHGKRGSVELIVRVIACLAEGMGIRGTARVCEVDPNTGDGKEQRKISDKISNLLIECVFLQSWSACLWATSEGWFSHERRESNHRRKRHEPALRLPS
jgi:hypothetical protein